MVSAGTGRLQSTHACRASLWAPLVTAMLVLPGCSQQEVVQTGGESSAPADAGSGSTPPGPANAPPTISGTPATSAVAGRSYVFEPLAADANGDLLSFSIRNRPSWASFSSTTGRLAGTPTAGTYAGIVISVSDGLASVSLPAFDIQTVAEVTGSASLSWTAPSRYENGNAIADLAGFRIYTGSSESNLELHAELREPSRTNYVIEGLAAGTHYFAISAFTAAGVESMRSNTASKSIR